MDFKKFGTVVLILGLIVLSYGGFQWVSNQPEKFNQAEPVIRFIDGSGI